MSAKLWNPISSRVVAGAAAAWRRPYNAMNYIFWAQIPHPHATFNPNTSL